MQEIRGKVSGTSRNVKTKYGDRTIVNILTETGKYETIWSDLDNKQMLRLCDGERVTIKQLFSGKWIITETAYDRAQNQRQEISPTILPVSKKTVLLPGEN